VAKAIGGRDLVEEYLAAKIWPLAFGWSATFFSKVKFSKMSHPIPCPQFRLEKPADQSDEMVVVGVEREANALLGVYNNKEHKAFLDCCSHGSRINRCFYEMGIQYEARRTPPEPAKTGRAAGNVGVEEPAAKKGKKEAA
jgi:hypothetical protein